MKINPVARFTRFLSWACVCIVGGVSSGQAQVGVDARTWVALYREMDGTSPARITQVSSDGTYRELPGGPLRPTLLVQDQKGGAWTNELVGPGAYYFRSDGDMSFLPLGGYGVQGITLDSYENVWFSAKAIPAGARFYTYYLVKYEPLLEKYTEVSLGAEYSSDLIADSEGNIWVKQSREDRNILRKFNNDGSFLFEVGTQPEDSDLCAGSTVLDSHGNCWTSSNCPALSGSPTTSGLYKYDSNGTLLFKKLYSDGNTYTSIAAASGDRLWAANFGKRSLDLFDRNGTLLYFYDLAPRGLTPGSLVVGGDQSVWFNAGETPGLIYRLVLRRTGATLQEIEISREWTTILSGDPSGFVLANVVQPFGDIDEDSYLNLEEITHHRNPLSARSIPYAWAAGTVNQRSGSTTATLKVNGTSGEYSRRRVSQLTTDPLRVEVEASPANGEGPTPFVLYAIPGVFDVSEVSPVELPFHIGKAAFSPPFAGLRSRAITLANNLGRAKSFGWPKLASDPATPQGASQVIQLPSGWHRPLTFGLQGLALDGVNQLSTTNFVSIYLSQP